MTVKEILKNQDGVNQEVFEDNSLKHMASISVMDSEELVDVITILNEKGYSIVKNSGIIDYTLVSYSKEEALQLPMNYSEEYTDGLGRVA